jgi:hypothetical protein
LKPHKALNRSPTRAQSEKPDWNQTKPGVFVVKPMSVLPKTVVVVWGQVSRHSPLRSEMKTKKSTFKRNSSQNFFVRKPIPLL